MSWGLAPPYICGFVAVCCVLSISVLRTVITETKLADLHKWKDFKRDLKEWKDLGWKSPTVRFSLDCRAVL